VKSITVSNDYGFFKTQTMYNLLNTTRGFESDLTIMSPIIRFMTDELEISSVMLHWSHIWRDHLATPKIYLNLSPEHVAGTPESLLIRASSAMAQGHTRSTRR
jgi:hypothetical protein